MSSDEAGTSSESSTGSSGETETDTGIKLDVGAETEGPPPAEAEVFGHSGTVLYRLDPDTLEVEVVGRDTLLEDRIRESILARVGVSAVADSGGASETKSP